jgi:hypothetical protein
MTEDRRKMTSLLGDPNTGTISGLIYTRPLLNFLTIETFQRLPADSPIYSLVGQVASDWAHLEHVLDLTIWELAEIPQQLGACMTAQIAGHHNKCDTIIALANHRGLSPATVKKVEVLKGALYDVSNPRNRIVHDPWILISKSTSDGHSHDPGQYKSMARKELKFGANKAEIELLEDTIKKIQQKIADCSALRALISAELKTLPKK